MMETVYALQLEWCGDLLSFFVVDFTFSTATYMEYNPGGSGDM